MSINLKQFNKGTETSLGFSPNFSKSIESKIKNSGVERHKITL